MSAAVAAASSRPTVGRVEEAGSGSVLAAGMVGVLLVLSLAASWLLALVLAAHRAEAAADLAALGGAERARGTGAGACSAAREVALANGARLDGCALGLGGEVSVRVSVPVAIVVPFAPERVGVPSRAGPAAGGWSGG